MPFAKFKTSINAAYDHVLQLLVDKAEKPRKYVPVVQHSAILERGKDYIIREMFQPQPAPMTIREKIYEREVPGGKEFIYEQLNNSDYTGLCHNILTKVPGNPNLSELEYIMDWKPHAGSAEKMSTATAEAMVKRGVEFMKAVAENPPEVPPLVKAFYEAVDSMKPDAMGPLLAKDCKFRMGNHTEVAGADNILKMNHEVMKRFAAIKHDVVDAATVGSRFYVESYVTYVLPDKSSYLLPFLTVFEHRQGLVAGVRVYGDASPLHHGWH